MKHYALFVCFFFFNCAVRNLFALQLPLQLLAREIPNADGVQSNSHTEFMPFSNRKTLCYPCHNLLKLSVLQVTASALSGEEKVAVLTQNFASNKFLSTVIQTLLVGPV